MGLNLQVMNFQTLNQKMANQILEQEMVNHLQVFVFSFEKEALAYHHQIILLHHLQI